jgi:release factor glutamine methyltransferase
MSALGDIYTHLKQKLAESGVESADFDVRTILKHRLNVDFSEIIANSARKMNDNDLKMLEIDIQRRINGEPLSRIHGNRGFYGREFLLGPDTLDPRPETEILVDRALKLFHGKHPARILDLGTGTGCIIITLLAEWPGAKGVATDISEGALETARRNAERHKVADRLELVRSNWGEAIEGRFDLVVSNPPYIRTSDIESLQIEVRNHDPILALDGGFDGLDAYRKIFFDLPRLLKPGGKALLEIGFGQESDLTRLSRDSRIRIIHTQPDYAGITRVVEISNGDK